MRTSCLERSWAISLLRRFVAGAVLVGALPIVAHASFTPGQIAVANSRPEVSAGVLVYSPSGAFERVLGPLNGPQFETFALAFNKSGSLLVSRQLFSSGLTMQTAVYSDPTDSPVFTFDGGGYSFAFDAAGNIFRLGIHRIEELTPTGQVIHAFELPDLGIWSIDLAADQCTMYFVYGSDGAAGHVGRYNVCSANLLADVPGTLDSFSSSAGWIRRKIRLLPDGSLLVTNEHSASRLTSDGQLISTYTLPTSADDRWAAIALTPGGDAFWVAVIGSPWLYRINLESGAVEGGPFELVYPFAGSIPAISVAGEWRAGYAGAASIPTLSPAVLVLLLVSVVAVASVRLRK